MRDVKLIEGQPEEKSAFSIVKRADPKAVGSSGTQVFGGYFAEEYLNKLRGTRAAKIWDEMRRSEPQVAMLLAAIMNPIKSATWTVDEAEDVANAEKHADLIKKCLFEMIDFEAFLHEALTMVSYGYSAFEVVHNVVENDPALGTFNGLAAIAYRSQKTIERWNLEKSTGKLLSVDQYVYSDIADSATIPAQFLLIFTQQKEGDNYEGVSLLRAMYGPWIRKNLYLKLCAIGTEKYAVGTPIGKVPAGKENTPDFDNFKHTLENYTSHEAAAVIVPAGWEVDIIQSDFDGSKMKELLNFENTEMVNAALANFLALGMQSNTGSFSLGADLSDFFMNGLTGIANIIRGTINRCLIPQLVKMNFGDQAAYPQLKVADIADNAGLELANAINALIGSKAIRPDDKLEDFLRRVFKLPPADPESSRDAAPPAPSAPEKASGKQPEAVDPETDDEAEAGQFAERKLDEKFVKKFDANKEAMKTTMQSGLRGILDQYKSKLAAKYNGAAPADRVKVVTQVEVPGMNAYRASIREVMAEVAAEAIEGARKEVPAAKNVKLAAPRGGYYNALPPAIKKIIDTQSLLVATTQIADVQKVTMFQFASSQASTENIDQILLDVEQAVGPMIEGSTKAGMSVDAAASNAVANVTNQARMEFFFEPEVLDEIESFTFENEDPISECCQELAGTTWGIGDPDIDRYTPPLHHNCKSRLVPNLKGDSGNPEISNGTAISQKALDAITLSEACYRIV